jgi:hypothetical protein
MAAQRTAADHHAQAQRNQAFYEQIGGSNSSTPEWAVTVLFYIAVHELEAALLACGEPRSKDHTTRRTGVRQRVTGASPGFEQLYQMSNEARYECVLHPQHRIALAEMQLALIRQEIAKVAPPPH